MWKYTVYQDKVEIKNKISKLSHRLFKIIIYTVTVAKITFCT